VAQDDEKGGKTANEVEMQGIKRKRLIVRALRTGKNLILWHGPTPERILNSRLALPRFY
jgi:hypothetical protein